MQKTFFSNYSLLPACLAVLFILPRTNLGHTLVLMEYQNMTTSSALDTFPKVFLAALNEQFKAFGVSISAADTGAISGSLAASDERTLLRAAAAGDSAIWVRVDATEGIEGKTFRKEIPYDGGASMDDNARALSLKLLNLFERQILSRVQVKSDPPGATLELDTLNGVTPFETFLTTGPHILVLSLDRHFPVSETLMVSPGSNRFQFSMVAFPPPAPGPSPRAPRPRSEWIYYLATAGAGLLAAAAQGLYSKTDREYDRLASSGADEYERLHDSAQRYLYLRNGFLALFGAAGLWSFYRLQRD